MRVDDAIRAVTMDAAYPIFADNKVGSLEVGKQADFVVLEKIHAQSQLQISEILRSRQHRWMVRSWLGKVLWR